ncbi:MAG: DUF4412 domain-containing protein [candidate division WOR-3 bacterium]
MKKAFCFVLIALFTLPLILFAGVEWEAQTLTKTKDKESKTIIRGYAQKGNVREEFVEVSEKENPLMKGGMYWLYLTDKNEIYIVDPENKEYFVMNVDSIARLMGSINKFVKFTISNPKIEMQELGTENILGVDCKHFKINSSYDMETKIMVMKMKTHNEESRELWTTTKHLEDISLNFTKKSISTGIADLDSLIRKEKDLYANIGFVLKSLVVSKTFDAKGKIVSETTTETVIEKLVEKNLSEELFKIPSDYKKVEFKINLENEE